jgi:hypothetical protein
MHNEQTASVSNFLSPELRGAFLFKLALALALPPKFCWVNISLATKYRALSHTVRKAEVEFSVFL